MVASVRRRAAAAVGALALTVSLLPVASSAARVGPSADRILPSASAPVRAVTATTRAWRAQAPAAVLVGRSVQRRSIVARRTGPADASYVVLVIGQMHGSEPKGRDVVREVARLAPPAGVAVWTISTMNPDGARVGKRRNARGVDLNRNFPNRWRRAYTRAIYNPGRRAASEPETRAMMTFLDRLRPDLIVSLHQAFRSVDIGNPKTRVWSVRLARALGLPAVAVPCRGPCAGTLAGWYNTGFAGYAVTVELPSRVSPSQARRFARSTLSVAAQLVPPTPPARPAPTTTPSPPPTDPPIPTPTPTETDTPPATTPAAPSP